MGGGNECVRVWRGCEGVRRGGECGELVYGINLLWSQREMLACQNSLSNSYTVPNHYAAGDGRFFFQTCHASVFHMRMVPLCLLPLPFHLLITKLRHLAYMHSAKSDHVQILQFKLYKLDSSQAPAPSHILIIHSQKGYQKHF